MKAKKQEAQELINDMGSENSIEDFSEEQEGSLKKKKKHEKEITFKNVDSSPEARGSRKQHLDNDKTPVSESKSSNPP